MHLKLSKVFQFPLFYLVAATLVLRCVRPGLARRSECSSGHCVPSELRCLAIAVAAPATEMAAVVSVQSAPETEMAAWESAPDSGKAAPSFFLVRSRLAPLAGVIGRSYKSLFASLSRRSNQLFKRIMCRYRTAPKALDLAVLQFGD